MTLSAARFLPGKAAGVTDPAAPAFLDEASGAAAPAASFLQTVVDQQRLVLADAISQNGLGHFAEHARAEGAVAHGIDDIADAMALLQIQRFEFLELRCLGGMLHCSLLVRSNDRSKRAGFKRAPNPMNLFAFVAAKLSLVSQRSAGNTDLAQRSIDLSTLSWLKPPK